MSKAKELWESIRRDILPLVELRDYAMQLEQMLSCALGAQARAEAERDEARRLVCRLSAGHYSWRAYAEKNGWDPDVLFPRVP
jgi:hypothetical protein